MATLFLCLPRFWGEWKGYMLGRNLGDLGLAESPFVPERLPAIEKKSSDVKEANTRVFCHG